MMIGTMTHTGGLRAREHLNAVEPRSTSSCRNSPLKVRFGERLRQLRQSRSYTQQQLADYLGIDRSFLSDVECGKKNLSLHLADTIAQGFHLSLADLLRNL